MNPDGQAKQANGSDPQRASDSPNQLGRLWRRFRAQSRSRQALCWFAAVMVVGGIGKATEKKHDSPDKTASTIVTTPATEAASQNTDTVPSLVVTTTTMSDVAAVAEGNVAQCKDRTFSDNTDFSGTCSSHRGVDHWLVTYGQCSDGELITMGKSASCDNHDGFESLMPADFVPTTTTLPPTTTTAPPALNTPCAEPQGRYKSLACVLTGFGPLWIDAPFASKDDQVGLLGIDATFDNHLEIDDMGVLAVGFQELTSYGQRYWCASVGIKNFDTDEASYNMFEWKLLTPSGSFLSPTVPLISNLAVLLQSGDLAPNGSVSGLVCFDQPQARAGRFAIAYQPLSFLSDAYALFYFDR